MTPNGQMLVWCLFHYIIHTHLSTSCSYRCLAKASAGTEMYRYWVGWVRRQFQSVAALSLDEIVSLLS